MHCKINRTALLQCLKMLVAVIQLNRKANDILENIIIDFQETEVRLFASGGQVNLHLVLRNNFELFEPGRICCSGKLLMDLLSKINQSHIELQTVQTRLKIIIANFRGEINLVDENNYPELDWFWQHNQPVQFKQTFLQEVVKKIAGAVSTSNEQTKMFNTVYFAAQEKQIRVLATDSVRLAVLEDTWNQSDLEFWVEPVILKIIQELPGETVQLTKSNQAIYCSGEDWYLKYQLFEGQYPNVSKIFTLTQPNEFQFSKQQLLNALDRGLQFAPDGTATVRCIIKRNILELQFKTELGQSQEAVPIKDSTTERLVFNFNGSQLIKLLRLFNGSNLLWKFASPETPVFFRDPEDPNFLQILFPMRNFE